MASLMIKKMDVNQRNKLLGPKHGLKGFQSDLTFKPIINKHSEKLVTNQRKN